MSKKIDNNLFPWDLYFSQSEVDNQTAILNCKDYPLNTLKVAAEVVFEKGSSSKKTTCEYIITGINKLIKKDVYSKPLNEQALLLINLKKDIKQNFLSKISNETPIKTPKKISDETPKKISDETPIKISDETPIKISDETPIKTPKKISDETPKKIPKKSIKKSEDTPIKIYEEKDISEKESINITVKLLKKLLEQQIVSLKEFKTLVSNSKETDVIKIYNAVTSHVTQKTIGMNNEDKNKWLKNQINELGGGDIVSSYLKKKGWDTNGDKSYLLNKMLEEETEFKDNENGINQESDRYHLLLAETQSKLAEQIALIQELKKLPNNKEKILKANTELDTLKKAADEIKNKIKEFDNISTIIDTARNERKKVCHELNYDSDIIDQAIIIDDLNCGESQVCNIETNKCEDKNDNVESHSVNLNSTIVNLIPVKAAKIFDKEQIGPRFVTLVDVKKKLDSSDIECFSKQDYNDIDELKEDLECDNERICDISSQKCIDVDDSMNISKINNIEYVYSDTKNIDLMSKLKQKFKNIVITKTTEEYIKTIENPDDIDSPVIDMEEVPAYVSERVSLQSFTNVMKSVQSKSRLSIDQKLNERTKARRDNIRKCLNI